MTAQAVVAGALLLAGCAAVGPDYRPPEFDAPAEYRGPLPGPPGDEAALATWWQAFDDPLLAELIGRGIAGNLDLQLALGRLREARALLRQAEAARSPSLDLGARGSAQAAARSGDRDLSGQIGASLEASWEADLFGGIRRTIEAREAGVGAAEERLRDVQVALAAEIGSNYIELRGAERRLAIALELLGIQRETLTLVEQRAEVGLASQLDVARSRSSVESLQAQIPRIEAEIREADHRLAVLLGLPPGALQAELAEQRPVPALVEAVDLGVPADLIRRRPDLRAAERELARATAEIGIAEAELYPRLTLPATLAVTAAGIGTGSIVESVVLTVSAALSQALADGGRRRAALEAAEERAEQALLQYRQGLLLALEDVERALSQYREARERHEALLRAVAADERAYQLALQLYQEGVTSFLDLLDAQRSLTASRQDLVVTEAALSTRLVGLYRALGGGWGEALSLARAGPAA